MGEEDVARQALNVFRMELLGATVHPVRSGSRTLKDAINEAMRDWVTNVAHDLLLHRLRDGAASVPDARAELPARDRRRGARPDPRARGPAPERPARLRRRRLQRDRPLPPVPRRPGRAARRRRAGGGGAPDAPPRRRADASARRASSTASARSCSPTTTARSSRPTPSPRGSTTRASDPSTPGSATAGAPRTPPSPTTEALDAFCWLSRTEGIIPALETAHAVARAPQARADAPARRDRDREPLGPRRQGRAAGARDLARAGRPDGRMSRIGACFAAAARPRRAGAVPFVTAGDPDLGTTEALVLAMAGAGADLIELGVPFSDPIAEGPTIQRASERALARGTSLRRVLELVKRLRARTDVPLLLMGYANPFYAMGPRGFADAAAAGGRRRHHRRGPAARGGRGPLRRRGGRRHRRRAARRADDDRRAAPAPRRAHAGLPLLRVAHRRHRRAYRRSPRTSPPPCARVKAVSDVPVCVGFGVSTAEHAREIARFARRRRRRERDRRAHRARPDARTRPSTRSPASSRSSRRRRGAEAGERRSPRPRSSTLIPSLGRRRLLPTLRQAVDIDIARGHGQAGLAPGARLEEALRTPTSCRRPTFEFTRSRKRARPAVPSRVQRRVGRHPGPRHARVFSTSVAICTNSTRGRTP